MTTESVITIKTLGIRSRTRECVFGVSNIGCEGESTQTLPCDYGEGTWQTWTQWTMCSVRNETYD